MLKATKQNDNGKSPLIISLALHIILIAVLIWSSFDENFDASAGGGGSDINAVMVDPGAIVNQYNREQQQQAARKRAEKQREERARKQEEELQKKQAAEQLRLKEIEKERLLAEEQTRKQLEQQRQAEEAAKKAQQQQAEAEAAAKARVAAEAKAAAIAKTKAEEQAKQKAVQQAKAARQKAAAAAKKEASKVDKLLDNLASAPNAPKQNQSRGAAGQGSQAKSGAGAAVVDNYTGQVQAAIRNKFYDWQLFKGQKCELRVRLAPNGGSLIDVQSLGGDSALCRAALAAAKQAIIPKPPNQDVYEKIKDTTITFNPQ